MPPFEEGELVARFHVSQLFKTFYLPQKPDFLIFEVLLMSSKARPPKSYKKLRLSYKKLRTSYEKLRKLQKATNSYEIVTKSYENYKRLRK